MNIFRPYVAEGARITLNNQQWYGSHQIVTGTASDNDCINVSDKNGMHLRPLWPQAWKYLAWPESDNEYFLRMGRPAAPLRMLSNLVLILYISIKVIYINVLNTIVSGILRWQKYQAASSDDKRNCLLLI